MFGRWSTQTNANAASRGNLYGTRGRRTAFAVTLIAGVAAAFGTILPAGAANQNTIETIAGSGAFGPPLGDGGAATAANLSFPGGVAVDKFGNTLIADTFDTVVRAVAATSGTFYGIAMTAGDIYTVAGNGTFSPQTGDGGPATQGFLAFPFGVTADHDGNIVIADTFHGRVRVVAGKSGTFYGVAMTAGDIYTVAGTTFGFSGDGGPATAAKLNRPDAVAVDPHGNLAIADFGTNRVRIVAAKTGTLYGVAMTAGDIYTVAGTGTAAFSGDGGPGTSAAVNSPGGLAVDNAGNLVIADSGNNVIRVLAAAGNSLYGVAMTAGDIYTVAGTGAGGFSGDGGSATSATLNFPNGVVVDKFGNLLVADSANNRIRAVAETNGDHYGVQFSTSTINTVAGSNISGFAGDGGPATSASLNFPEGVALDGAGNILIADSGNGRVRIVGGP